MRLYRLPGVPSPACSTTVRFLRLSAPANMEDVDMEAASPTADEFGAAVLSQFINSKNELHLRVCAAISTMTQELKEQNILLTPIAYFGATCSSLDRLSSNADPAAGLLDALLTVLFLVIDRVSHAVLKMKYVYLSELLIRSLRVNSLGVDGVLHGMKCASRLLIVRKNVGWTDLAQLYGVLISYISDDRLKVRKQSHSCLREVLGYFNLSPSLASSLEFASEAIMDVFGRFLQLAGCSDPIASEGPKAAQELLYVLDALKVCLPYLSGQSTTNILKYFKSLLKLRHPVVTTRITDCLHALCLHSTGEISAEILCDLLRTLAAPLSLNESSADSMSSTARLLDAGMKRVYSLNRQICVLSLPDIFNGLKGILASRHEEALVAAVATFKSLINTCIDEVLITQGVDQITASSHAADRKPSPSIIEDVCVIIESLLDYQYEAVWDTSFQIVSTMFEKLGEHSCNLLKVTLESLGDMQKFIPDECFALRKQLSKCIGTALSVMGPEEFLRILPLQLDLEDPSEGNLWLFPILKQYTVGAHLSFFIHSILPKIGKMKEKSAWLEQRGKLYSSRITEGIVYSLWSLLPSFCNYPIDTAKSFKSLEMPLCTALQEEADVRAIICASLRILIQQNKGILEGIIEHPRAELGVARKRAIALYNADVADSNLSTLKSSAPGLLNFLIELFFKSSKDTGGNLQSTIGELASISDKRAITRCFKRMQSFLKITQEAGKSVNSKDPNSMQVDNLSFEGSLSTYRAQLFDLAASLLPGLDSMQIVELFNMIRPALKDTDGLIQKKAYRVLSLIFQKFDDFISRKFTKILHLMRKVGRYCHFSAKPHRLNCLRFLIIHVFKEGLEQSRPKITTSILVEIVLALKEANKRARNSASETLVQIGHACGDEEQGGEEKLQNFFCMVARGRSGLTCHMISATTIALARLVYEFSDLASLAYEFLPSSKLSAHQRMNKEIIKANLGLLKVLVVKSPADCVETHLPDMMKELLHWKDGTRNNFNTKVKHLLEMLVQKCGLDAVQKVIPKKHMNLLTYIEKLKKQKERKRSAASVEDRSIVSKATTSRISRWNYTRIFSDFEEDERRNSDGEFADERSISSRWSKYASGIPSELSLLRTKRARKQAKSLQEDSFDQLDDEPLDLLTHQKMRSALLSSKQVKRKPDSDDELEIDSEGRLIILEDGKTKKSNQKNKQDLPSESEFEGRSQTGSHLSESSRKTQKRRKTSESGWAYTGKEYTSKKASGDVTRKDKVEPYAYWPLDRKMVSRKPEQRAAARKGMASVVKLTKRFEGRSVSNALSMKGVMLKRCKKICKK